MQVVLGSKRIFSGGVGKIKFEGPASDNPLAFKWYDENRIIAGKKLKEYVKFAVAYWHSFCNTGGDPFGPGTKFFPWNVSGDALQAGKDKMDAAFELMTQTGLCRIIVFTISISSMRAVVHPNMKKGCRRLVEYAKQKQTASGVKLLWGTANVFSNPRYMSGAATCNPDFTAVAYAGSAD